MERRSERLAHRRMSRSQPYPEPVVISESGEIVQKKKKKKKRAKKKEPSCGEKRPASDCEPEMQNKRRILPTVSLRVTNEDNVRLKVGKPTAIPISENVYLRLIPDEPDMYNNDRAARFQVYQSPRSKKRHNYNTNKRRRAEERTAEIKGGKGKNPMDGERSQQYLATGSLTGMIRMVTDEIPGLTPPVEPSAGIRNGSQTTSTEAVPTENESNPDGNTIEGTQSSDAPANSVNQQLNSSPLGSSETDKTASTEKSSILSNASEGTILQPLIPVIPTPLEDRSNSVTNPSQSTLEDSTLTSEVIVTSTSALPASRTSSTPISTQGENSNSMPSLEVMVPTLPVIPMPPTPAATSSKPEDSKPQRDCIHPPPAMNYTAQVGGTLPTSNHITSSDMTSLAIPGLEVSTSEEASTTSPPVPLIISPPVPILMDKAPTTLTVVGGNPPSTYIPRLVSPHTPTITFPNPTTAPPHTHPTMASLDSATSSPDPDLATISPAAASPDSHPATTSDPHPPRPHSSTTSPDPAVIALHPISTSPDPAMSSDPYLTTTSPHPHSATTTPASVTISPDPTLNYLDPAVISSISTLPNPATTTSHPTSTSTTASPDSHSAAAHSDQATTSLAPALNYPDPAAISSISTLPNPATATSHPTSTSSDPTTASPDSHSAAAPSDQATTSLASNDSPDPTLNHPDPAAISSISTPPDPATTTSHPTATSPDLTTAYPDSHSAAAPSDQAMTSLAHNDSKSQGDCSVMNSLVPITQQGSTNGYESHTISVNEEYMNELSESTTSQSIFTVPGAQESSSDLMAEDDYDESMWVDNVEYGQVTVVSQTISSIQLSRGQKKRLRKKRIAMESAKKTSMGENGGWQSTSSKALVDRISLTRAASTPTQSSPDEENVLVAMASMHNLTVEAPPSANSTTLVQSTHSGSHSNGLPPQDKNMPAASTPMPNRLMIEALPLANHTNLVQITHSGSDCTPGDKSTSVTSDPLPGRLMVEAPLSGNNTELNCTGSSLSVKNSPATGSQVPNRLMIDVSPAIGDPDVISSHTEFGQNDNSDSPVLPVMRFEPLQSNRIGTNDNGTGTKSQNNSFSSVPTGLFSNYLNPSRKFSNLPRKFSNQNHSNFQQFSNQGQVDFQQGSSQAHKQYQFSSQNYNDQNHNDFNSLEQNQSHSQFSSQFRFQRALPFQPVFNNQMPYHLPPASNQASQPLFTLSNPSIHFSPSISMQSVMPTQTTSNRLDGPFTSASANHVFAANRGRSQEPRFGVPSQIGCSFNQGFQGGSQAHSSVPNHNIQSSHSAPSQAPQQFHADPESNGMDVDEEVQDEIRHYDDLLVKFSHLHVATVNSINTLSEALRSVAPHATNGAQSTINLSVPGPPAGSARRTEPNANNRLQPEQNSNQSTTSSSLDTAGNLLSSITAMQPDSLHRSIQQSQPTSQGTSAQSDRTQLTSQGASITSGSGAHVTINSSSQLEGADGPTTQSTSSQGSTGSTTQSTGSQGHTGSTAQSNSQGSAVSATQSTTSQGGTSAAAQSVSSQRSDNDSVRNEIRHLHPIVPVESSSQGNRTTSAASSSRSTTGEHGRRADYGEPVVASRSNLPNSVRIWINTLTLTALKQTWCIPTTSDEYQAARMRGVTQDKEHGGMWKDPTPQANRRYNDPASIPNGSLVPDWYDKPSSTWNSFVFQTLAERTHIAIQAGAWDVLYPETREFRPYSHPELLQDTFPDRFRRFKKEYIAQRPGNTAERDKLVVENQLTAKRGRRDHRMNSLAEERCNTVASIVDPQYREPIENMLLGISEDVFEADQPNSKKTHVAMGLMSDDESIDGDERTSRTYAIKPVQWRDYRITAAFRHLDQHVPENRPERSAGNVARRRVFTDTAGATASSLKSRNGKGALDGAPKCLPINYYCKTWISRLKAKEKTRLQAKPALIWDLRGKFGPRDDN